jgi:hypothetical protein
MNETSRPESGPLSSSSAASIAESSAVREIMRGAATLALAWGVPPATVLFILAGEAPPEVEWGRLVSRTWDRLPASQRANLNALSSKEAA